MDKKSILLITFAGISLSDENLELNYFFFLFFRSGGYLRRDKKN